MLVAAELMRRGVEVAHPASDVGVDLLAYRLLASQTVAAKFVPIQVKTASKFGYAFQRVWFAKCPGVALVLVWHVTTTPEFYVLASIADVEAAIKPHIRTISWARRGIWTTLVPGKAALARMEKFRDGWDRITNQLA